MTTETETIITLQGVDLPVIRKGSGPQILMLHGGDGPIAHLPFVDELAQQYEIIHPIHPGFAGTPIPDHFDSLQDLLFLYLDLIDELEACAKKPLLGRMFGKVSRLFPKP